MKKSLTQKALFFLFAFFSSYQLSAQTYDVGVFYMPLFYYDNNDWTSSPHWQRVSNYHDYVVSKGRPDMSHKPLGIYPGAHPTWYDEKSPAVTSKQLELMSNAGINFTIYNSYYTWYGNTLGQYWSHSMDNWLTPGFNNHGMKFAMMWSEKFNTLINDGKCRQFFQDGGGLDQMLDYWVKYITNPNYKRIDDKPVIYILYPTPKAANIPSYNIEGMCTTCDQDPFFNDLVDRDDVWVQHKRTKYLLNKIKQKLIQKAAQPPYNTTLTDIYFVATITNQTRTEGEPVQPESYDWLYKWEWLIRHPAEGGFNALTSYGYGYFHYSDFRRNIQTSPPPGCTITSDHNWDFNYITTQRVYRDYYNYILTQCTAEYQVPVMPGFSPGAANMDNPQFFAADCDLYIQDPSQLSISTPATWASSLYWAKNAADNYPSKTRKTIIISAWNENTEGKSIEPSEQWGYQYLNAINEVLYPTTPPPPPCCSVPPSESWSITKPPVTAIGTPESFIDKSGSNGSMEFIIAPNPVRNNINLKLSQNQAFQWHPSFNTVSFYLYDMNTHSLVKSWENNSVKSQYNFDIKGIKAGQYIMEMSSGKIKKGKQVIIKD